MITTPFLILYSGIIIIIFYLYEIKKNITSPDFYYMTVYLCVRPDDQPNDISNQWLMERFLSFRIIPRIGDSLVVPIWANKLPTVTEIKLHRDGVCEVWCDVTTSADNIAEKVAELHETYGWHYTNTSNPKFHHLVNEVKLEHRKYTSD